MWALELNQTAKLIVVNAQHVCRILFLETLDSTTVHVSLHWFSSFQSQPFFLLLARPSPFFIMRALLSVSIHAPLQAECRALSSLIRRATSTRTTSAACSFLPVAASYRPLISRSAFSSTAHSSAAPLSKPPPLHASQTYILLPQLSPRMEMGRVVRWLLKEGDELKPHQVFMHVEVSERAELLSSARLACPTLVISHSLSHFFCLSFHC
jgi:hypothetical protein